jgi:ribose 5-phosphate isomerase B
MESKIIALGSDHAGFLMKEYFISFLNEIGIETIDFGCFSENSVDYPDFAHPVALAVEEKKANFGLLFCGSGNGVAIVANKHQGIRAALCWTNELSILARQHNDANILCIPSRFIDLDEAKKMIISFVITLSLSL